MREWKAVALRQSRQNVVLVIDETALGQNQHRQALIGFAEEFDHFLARFWPCNAATSSLAARSGNDASTPSIKAQCQQ